MEHIVVEDQGPVRTVRMSRPAKKNALTVAMYEALNTALRGADEDPAIRVVVVTGEPGIFTAGNDLGDFMQQPPNPEDSAVFRVLEALRILRKPLIAAVDGMAIGLGTTMLLHCDLVYASTRARFQLPFVNLGLVPEGASSLLLPQRVGLQRSAEWLFFGEPFDAEAARAAGLVNAVLDPDKVLPHAQERALALAGKPPEALQATKRLLRQPYTDAVAEAFKREGAEFVARLRSPEAMAAFTAFFTKK